MRRGLLVAITALLLTTSATVADAAPPAPTSAEERRRLDEATALTAQLGRLYAAGRYDEALPIGERALQLREETLGPDDPAVGTTLANVALLYRAKGDYARAGPLYERVLRIDEKALGPDHLEVAADLNALGLLYRMKGDGARAEPLYERALRIREKTLGPDDPKVATSLNNLAGLYYSRGDLGRAEPLLERALRIDEKALGADHLEVATDLNNLAELRRTKGELARAEQLFSRALRIREKALGPDHPDIAVILHNLGALYQQTGDIVRAESVSERALRIREKSLGPEHPDVAGSLNSLATIYESKGDYVRAEALYERALRIREKALGVEHPDVAGSLTNLAKLHEAKGDVDRALGLTERAGENEERTLGTVLASSADAQRRAFFATLRGRTDGAVSLHVQSAPRSERAARLALTTLLRRKGRVLDAGTGMLGELRRKARPEDQKLLDTLQKTRAELSTRTLRGRAAESAAEHTARLDSLREDARKVEEDLARRYTELRGAGRPVTIEAVQQALGEGQALVELAVYRPFDPKKGRDPWGEPRYVAYVLKKTGPPRHVELGAAAAIDASVKELRTALASASPTYAALARRLDEHVTAKVRPLLGGASDILVSPDGALGMIPFAALVDEHERSLTETMRFTYLTSGRDLLRLQDATPSRDAPLVLAAPDYDTHDAAAAETTEPASAPGAGTRSMDFGKVRFPPLPGTSAEARALSQLLIGAKVLTGAEATEEVLRGAHGPRILHVATHGFFLEDVAPPGGAGADQRGLTLEASAGAPGVALSEDPLLRAGLALAGANQRRAGKDDGVLTALDATSLDLWGTKLVTLSACETGVGEVKNGDGIYGLRRALVLAGSEAQMMSLWKVDDRATEQLMTLYYARLLRGGGRSDALREVQLEMMAKPATAHPFYWASFIVSGDQRTLDGMPAPAVRAAGAVTGAAVKPVAQGARGCGCEVAPRREESSSAGALLCAACIALAGQKRLLRRRQLRHSRDSGWSTCAR